MTVKLSISLVYGNNFVTSQFLSDYLSPDMPGGPDKSLQMSTQPFKVAVERTKSKVDPEGKEDNDC